MSLRPAGGNLPLNGGISSISIYRLGGRFAASGYPSTALCSAQDSPRNDISLYRTHLPPMVAGAFYFYFILGVLRFFAVNQLLVSEKYNA